MLNKYFGVIVGILVFIIYLFTIAPTIVTGDAGELATVQATLGIAHPTGYPLFTLIGHLFYLVPLPFSAIFKFNLLSSLYCSISVVFIAHIIKLIIENLEFTAKYKHIDSEKNQVTKSINSTSVILTSSFGALLWAFSYLVWTQSTSTEVYSLHICLLSAIIYFALKAYYSELSGKSELVKWLIISLFLILGFSNHLTTIFVIPGLLFLLYKKHGISRLSGKIILLSALITVVGVVLFYSYLIIRSNQGPIMNWGDPSSLSRLIQHISGGQYHSRLFFDLSFAITKFQYIFETVLNTDFWEFHIGIFFSLVATVILVMVNRAMFVFLFTCIIVTLIVSIIYNIPDINTYFFLIYFCLAILAAIGIHVISIILPSKIPSYLTIFILGGTVLFFEISQHYSMVNRNDYYILEDYTRELLNSVEKNAVIVTDGGAPFFFPCFYYQLVEEMRRDVTVVCTTMEFDWYKNSIHKISPDLLNTETNQFTFNPDARPVYVYSQLINALKLPSGYFYKPDLYLFKIEKDEKYMELKSHEVSIRTENILMDYEFEVMQKNICDMLESRALYESKFNNKNKTVELLEIIRSKFPDYTFSMEWDSILSKLDTH